MKPRRSNQTNQALTLMEVLVIVAVIVVLAALLLPAFQASERKAQRINCLTNLKEIDLATRAWAGDHFDQYPTQATVTNDGTTELLSAGVPPSQLVLWNFMVMSNELGTPKVLHCPADDRTTAVRSFTSGFSQTNISYFFCRDAVEAYPQMILSGDDNLTINGAPIGSGFLDIPTNATAAWTAERHYRCGNIALADGSQQMVNDTCLQQTLQQTGAATNHFAIP